MKNNVSAFWRGKVIASLEWCFQWQAKLGAEVNFYAGHRQSDFVVLTPFGNLFPSLSFSPLPSSFGKNLEFGLRVWFSSDGLVPHFPGLLVRWVFAHEPLQWSHRDPWWQYLYIDLVQEIVGQQNSTCEVVEKRSVTIPMPEGPLQAEVTLSDSTISFARWPWPKTVRCAEVVPQVPPTVPGKGENGWDCGDETIGAMRMPARSIEEAVGVFVGAILKTRQDRSGRWQSDAAEARSS